MKKLGRNLIELEHHQLEMPLEYRQLADSGAVRRLTESIDAVGQIEPCLAVKQGERYLLIDGYLRIQALQRCQRDKVWLEWVDCDLETGLTLALRRNQGRKWTPLEEAWLIRELVETYGQSQQEVAHALGKSASWVCRRLALLEGLPDPVQQAVKDRLIKPWAANRVLAPLARANLDHAVSLLDSLKTHPMSTRELATFFKAYEKSPNNIRAKMIGNPPLTLKTLRFLAEQQEAVALEGGPEAIWLSEIEILRKRIEKLTAKTDVLVSTGAFQGRSDLHEAFDQVTTQWQQFQELMNGSRYEGRTDSTSNPGDACPGDLHPGDQQTAQSIPQAGAAGGAPGGDHPKKEENQRKRRSRSDSPALQKVQGQCGEDPRDHEGGIQETDGLQLTDADGSRGPPPRNQPQGRFL